MGTLPGWAVTLVSIIATLVAFGLLIGTAVLVAWLRGEQFVGSTVRVILIWSAVCSILAFAGGGWLAARLGRIDRAGPAALMGALVGLGTVLVIAVSAGAALGEQMDFHSVAVAIGYIEEVPATEQLPFPIATPPPSAQTTVDQEHLARTRSITTVAYVGILALSGVVAGAAGGSLAAARSSDQEP